MGITILVLRRKKSKSTLSETTGFTHGPREEASVKEKSQLNEARLSKLLGFTLQPGSGCSPWIGRKGDGITDDFLVECKETVGTRIAVTEKILEKIFREAVEAGKSPILVLSLYGMKEHIPRDWVLVPAGLLEEDTDE